MRSKPQCKNITVQRAVHSEPRAKSHVSAWKGSSVRLGMEWLIPAGSIASCWDCEGYQSHSQPHPISPSAWVIVTCSDHGYAVAIRPPQIYEGIAMLAFLPNSPFPFSSLSLKLVRQVREKKISQRLETRTQTQHMLVTFCTDSESWLMYRVGIEVMQPPKPSHTKAWGWVKIKTVLCTNCLIT